MTKFRILLLILLLVVLGAVFAAFDSARKERQLRNYCVCSYYHQYQPTVSRQNDKIKIRIGILEDLGSGTEKLSDVIVYGADSLPVEFWGSPLRSLLEHPQLKSNQEYDYDVEVAPVVFLRIANDTPVGYLAASSWKRGFNCNYEFSYEIAQRSKSWLDPVIRYSIEFPNSLIDLELIDCISTSSYIEPKEYRNYYVIRDSRYFGQILDAGLEYIPYDNLHGYLIVDARSILDESHNRP